MADTLPEDARPRLTINKAGWRAVAVGATVVGLGLVGALLAQTTVAPGSDATQRDALTTVTLLLAVLAFLIQIFVFIFQTNSSNRSIERSEELNSRSHGVLDQIQASSDATQKVLFAQFDRLLDYVVGPDGQVVDRTTEQRADEESSSPLDEESVRRIVEESLRPPRPSFAAGPGSDPQQKAIGDQIRRLPSRSEAEDAVKEVQKLSPAAIVKLAQHAIRALNGLRPYVIGVNGVSESSQQLIDAGLLTQQENQLVLTDRGAAISRVAPLPRGRDGWPEWWSEVVAPLLAPST